VKPDDPLRTTLLDLLWELRGADIRLILGGGYGLYLRQLDCQASGAPQTFIPKEQWPLPRATADLDVFLKTEIVVSIEKCRAIRAALDHLCFAVVEEAKYTQFSKAIDASRMVKIDLLTGPVPANAVGKLHVKGHRVRPKESIKLHAHIAVEAIELEQNLIATEVRGTRSDGTAVTGRIYLPHPFPFLLMKLHAYDDRKDDADVDLGRHHALDVYRIVAMLDEAEYKATKEAVSRHGSEPVVARAKKIIETEFGTVTARGMLRIREHKLFQPNLEIARFRQALFDFFLP